MKPLFIPAEEQNILIHQITEKYIRRFFSSGKKYIKGPEILHFCDNQQLNRFIFFQLHQEWNKYQAGIVNPSYDFQHEEVKKALSTFLNTLSAHILITERDFRSYVEKAVFNTLSLLLTPEETFDSFYFSAKESINLVVLEKNAAYFSYFDFILQGIIVYHQNQNMPLVRKRIFLEKFAKAEELAAKKGKSLENYRRELFRLFTEKDLFEVARTADGSIPVPELSAGKESGASLSTVDLSLTADTNFTEENISLSTEDIAEITEADPILSETENTSDVIPENTVSENPETQAPQAEIPSETESAPAPVLIVDDFADEDTPVVEDPAVKVSESGTSSEPAAPQSPVSKEAEEKPETVADLFQKKTGAPRTMPAEPISLDNIPIHKQFQFSQKIFLGNNVMFRAFVQEVNKTETWAQTENLLNEKVILPNNLKTDDALLLEFIQILKNRYEI